MLSSIYTLARHCAREKEENPEHCDHFESHVFFDGGVNGTTADPLALQLVSLLQESVKVDPRSANRTAPRLQVTQMNDTVSSVFVLFQGILVFSTAISPATVILVIASGFSSAYKVSDSSIMATIIILLILSVAYGIFCLYGNPQHQLDVAKFATFVFAIIMGVVFAGNLKNIIYDFIMVGKTYWPCSINVTTNLSTCHNNTHEFMFPLTPSTMYLVLFTLLFISSGLFHLNEFSCLIHGVWYFLALPSGYLLLLIYSVANLDDRSWGQERQYRGTSKWRF
eukprot:Em0285g7a